VKRWWEGGQVGREACSSLEGEYLTIAFSGELIEKATPGF
jgi:hypothetical protein